MAIETRVRKWGNSMGIVLPKEFVAQNKLKEDDKVTVQVVKVFDLSKAFGIIKKTKMTGQEFKDMVREGWEKKR